MLWSCSGQGATESSGAGLAGRNDATDVPVQASDCLDPVNPNVLIDPNRATREVGPLPRAHALNTINVPNWLGIVFAVAGPRAVDILDFDSMNRYT